ncbi:MAG: DUF4410 domain-containing protein [Chthoniobacterales bacterium]
MKFFLPLLLALAGCSSVSVLQERENADLAPAARPGVLYVRPFEVRRGVEFDAAAAKPGEDVEAKVGALVAEGILSRASEWIAPGQLLESSAPAPSEGLLVQGKILRLRQGSRALRMGIGFGAGRTRLETSVRVFNLSASATEPWLSFETTGGSNMEPGIIGAVVPSPVSIPIAVSVIGSAVTAGAIGVKGVTQDAERTGRVIAAAVHDKLAKRKLVERVTTAKRAGRLATPVGEVPVPAVE